MRILPLVLLLACNGDKTPPPGDSAAMSDSAAPSDSGSDGGDAADTGPRYRDLDVYITLDGEPAADVLVVQPGTDQTWRSDADGRLTVSLDTRAGGEVGIAASHPEARIGGTELLGSDWEGELEIALERYDTSDNPDYSFQHPGQPDPFDDTTAHCSHCHITFTQDWWASAHRQSASNPVVQDLYAGAASAWTTETDCEANGGQWWSGLEPGTGAATERCYAGAGTLVDLNEDCGTTGSCDGVATQTGQCADCHAPGIDGELGGRDLLDATEHAYDYGVHCDVCHRVDSVDPDAAGPGVAGKLQLTRPSEDPLSPTLGEFAPLTFGPYPDVLNVRMGSVQRDHFTTADFCAGCHQHDQAVLVPGESIDTARWPLGTLPVHSTYQELESGPMGGLLECQACHMPPDPTVGNSADLGNLATDDGGMVAGWFREPGDVRRHVWFGPRHDEERMVDLAALLTLDASLDAGTLRVDTTVTNVGPGHAIPTGEPLRSLVLLVQATCEGTELVQTDGAIVPDFGGALETRRGGDWTLWPDAQAGQRLRVVAQSDDWYDYTGFGPFGDGSFDAADKGMPVENPVGEVEILSVDSDGNVTLSDTLPDGDVVYRVDATDWPTDGDPAAGWAGAPGFGFARVMTGADGARMVPHHAAVDIASDNRLMPQDSWTSTLDFAATCDTPTVDAALIHRAYPLELAAEKGWSLSETVMATASATVEGR